MQKNLHMSKKSSTFAAENIKQRFYILRIIVHNKIIFKCLTIKKRTKMEKIKRFFKNCGLEIIDQRTENEKKNTVLYRPLYIIEHYNGERRYYTKKWIKAMIKEIYSKNPVARRGIKLIISAIL